LWSLHAVCRKTTTELFTAANATALLMQTLSAIAGRERSKEMFNRRRTVLLTIFLIAVFFTHALGGLVLAPEQSDERQVSPSKVLILGVPYISWSEAHRLDYVDKDILNPSFAASLGMILKYWDQDLKLLKRGEDALGWGIVEQGKRKNLDELKSFIARGIPVLVLPAITPFAHSLSPTFVIMEVLGLMKGFKFRDQVPASAVLGRMESLDTFNQLKEFSLKEKMDLKLNESALVSARVVIGYDDDRKVLTLHDPSFGPAFEVSYDDFDKMWSVFDRTYIAAYPPNYKELLLKRATASQYRARTPDEQAAEHFVFGYALSSVGQSDEAEKHFKKGLAISGIGKAYEHLLLFELANVYWARGNIEDAFVPTQKAISILPEHGRPHLLLAGIYEARGEKQRASDEEKKGQELCSDHEAMKMVKETLGRDFFVSGCGK